MRVFQQLTIPQRNNWSQQHHQQQQKQQQELHVHQQQALTARQQLWRMVLLS
jgi:hypothetical protein